jgi:hypothetical protein
MHPLHAFSSKTASIDHPHASSTTSLGPEGCAGRAASHRRRNRARGQTEGLSHVTLVFDGGKCLRLDTTVFVDQEPEHSYGLER